MLDFIPNTVALSLTVLFPTYASFKALSSRDPALLTPWLTYFLTFSLITTFESFFSFILCYVPFYAWIRLVLHLYLLLPGEHQGAAWIYSTYIRPFLVEHDAWIEDFISTGHDRFKVIGLEYLKRALNYVRALLLGQDSQQQRTSSSVTTSPQKYTAMPAEAAPQQSYAQSLLARFSLPSAQVPITTTTPTSPSQTDIYALLSSLLQATTSNPHNSPLTNPTPNPPTTSTGAALIPSHLSTPQENLTYITAQTARLRALLGAFDTQAQAITRDQSSKLPEGSASADIKKSASVGEFEEIKYGDAVPTVPTSPSPPSKSDAMKKGWVVWGWRSGAGSGVAA